MKRISTSTAHVDKHGVGKNGFRDGNKAAGIAATKLDAAIFDHIQEEIAGVIEGFGAVLNPADMHQMHTVIAAAIAAAGSGLPAASDAETAAGVLTTKAVTPASLMSLFTGTNRSLATNGYIKLPGGLIIQWGTSGSIASAGSLAITLPVAFPTAHLCSLAARSSNVAGATGYAFWAYNTSLSQITVYNSTAGAGVAFWLAIGY